MEEILVKCDELSIEIDFDGKIKGWVAKKGVRIVRGILTCECDLAVFENLSRKVVATGNPKLKQIDKLIVFEQDATVYLRDDDRFSVRNLHPVGRVTPAPIIKRDRRHYLNLDPQAIIDGFNR